MTNPEKQYLVSIITVNYNGLLHTIDLLKSINRITYPKLEVIVVDNASQQDPTLPILEIYPATHVIRSETNLGFAGGNNLGVKQAKGDFLFFVNNDTELTEGLIENMLNTFIKYPDAGAVSPKFHYYFHPNIIEYAGYNGMNFYTARASMRGNREVDTGKYISSETHFAHGGGMMVSREVIKNVGLMPECYFLYYEELDWCEHMKRMGYKIYFEANALIYHKESMTTGKSSTLKTYYLNRNRILFIRRNATAWQKFSFMVYFTLFTLPKNTLQYVLKREWSHLKSFFKAVIWNFRNPAHI